MSNDENRDPALDYHFGGMNLGQPSPSTTSNLGPLPGSGVAANTQSASARFERFFNTSSPMGDPYGRPTYQSGLPLPRGGSPSPYGNIGGAVPSDASMGGERPGGPFVGGQSGGGSAQAMLGFPVRPPIPGLPFEPSRSGISPQWAPESTVGGGALELNASTPIPPSAVLPPFNSFYSPQPFYGTPAIHTNNLPNPPAGDPADEDVIPTAIVVKNIPFNVKKEQLLQIIEDLAIPMPYAFNYHYDQGIFRGLAFANFRSAEEADAVVAALNGFDVVGRKLRVEYKKVLQAGEKERIEKEKAIKRMRSMVMEKERIKRESGYGAAALGAGEMPPPPLPGRSSPIPTLLSVLGGRGAVEDQKSTHVSSTMYVEPVFASPPALTADALQSIPSSSGHGDSGASAPNSERSNTGGASLPGAPRQQQAREELDLNDPQTLEIYSRVLLFKDDRMRDELAFSRSLNPVERRTVHLVAQKLKLFHYSIGEGDERHVIVAKHEVTTNGGRHRPLRSQASTIGRSGREAGHPGGVGMGGSGSTSRNGLRGKKSAPDMKRNRDSFIVNSNGQGGPFNGSALNFGAGGTSDSGYFSVNGSNTSSSGSFMGRKSNGNLRDSYSSSSLGGLVSGGTPGQRRSHQGGGGVGGAAGLQSLFASQFEVPPVPSLGSAYLGSAPPLSATLSNHSGSGDTHLLVRSDSPLSPVSATGYPSQQQPSFHHHTPNGAASSGALRQPRGPPTPGGQGISAQNDIRNFGPRSRLSTQSMNTNTSSSSSSHGANSSSHNFGYDSSNGTSMLSISGGAGGKARTGSGHGGAGITNSGGVGEESIPSPSAPLGSLSGFSNASWRQQPPQSSTGGGTSIASPASSITTLQQQQPPPQHQS